MQKEADIQYATVHVHMLINMFGELHNKIRNMFWGYICHTTWQADKRLDGPVFP